MACLCPMRSAAHLEGRRRKGLGLRAARLGAKRSRSSSATRADCRNANDRAQGARSCIIGYAIALAGADVQLLDEPLVFLGVRTRQLVELLGAAADRLERTLVEILLQVRIAGAQRHARLDDVASSNSRHLMPPSIGFEGHASHGY